MVRLPPSARLGAVGLVHPFPSALVALSAGALGLIAGGSIVEATLLTLSMAGFQASIGALNDVHDRDGDALGQPWKPIPSGRVGLRAAYAAAAVGAAVGVIGSLALGPATLLVGLLGFALGVAYDLRLKGTAWGWLCLALALPLVPVYAWLGVGAGLPPALGTLCLLGGLAGLELAVANGLVDAPGDGRLGGRGIAIRLGPQRARVVMAAAAVGVVGLAWLTLLGLGGAEGWLAPDALLIALLVGSVILVGGLAMSLRRDAVWSWRGWQVQALGVAVVALVWLASAG